MLPSSFFRVKCFLGLKIIIIQPTEHIFIILIRIVLLAVSVAKNTWWVAPLKYLLLLIVAWEEDLVSLKHILPVHLTLRMLFCDFLLKLGQLFLNVRINITLAFQRATGKSDLVAVGQDSPIDNARVNAPTIFLKKEYINRLDFKYISKPQKPLTLERWASTWWLFERALPPRCCCFCC